MFKFAVTLFRTARISKSSLLPASVIKVEHPGTVYKTASLSAETTALLGWAPASGSSLNPERIRGIAISPVTTAQYSDMTTQFPVLSSQVANLNGFLFFAVEQPWSGEK